eukprot:IDg8854t1
MSPALCVLVIYTGFYSGLCCHMDYIKTFEQWYAYLGKTFTSAISSSNAACENSLKRFPRGKATRETVLIVFKCEKVIMTSRQREELLPISEADASSLPRHLRKCDRVKTESLATRYPARVAQRVPASNQCAASTNLQIALIASKRSGNQSGRKMWYSGGRQRAFANSANCVAERRRRRSKYPSRMAKTVDLPTGVTPVSRPSGRGGRTRGRTRPSYPRAASTVLED